MKCPRCGADSHVYATRKYKDVLLRRQRLCFNEHKFDTYEVFAGNLDRRKLDETCRGIAVRKHAWHIRRVVLASALTATELARKLGVTEARVRQIRSRAKESVDGTT
jgi:transcriptional regulator NrdR family protein